MSILYGTGGEKLKLHYDQPRGKGVLYQPFEGVCNNIQRRYKETQSDSVPPGAGGGAWRSSPARTAAGKPPAEGSAGGDW